AAYISQDSPLIGIEPSAILTIRDEYIDLADSENKEKAIQLAKYTFTIEEFLYFEFQNKVFSAELFKSDTRMVSVHGHCYQKTLSSQQYTKDILSIPVNYDVTIIPSGCCGMAGSFGYEKEHYEVSQQVGNLILYPH